MSRVHVECKPDEALLRKFGFSGKQVFHHDDKGRVFNYIRDKINQVAMVDEDPRQARHPYERDLVPQEEKNGVIRLYDKKHNNTVFVLKVKLEDWIIECCRKCKIDITKYGSLPSKPNELHKVINDRLSSYKDLIDALLEEKDNGVVTLKTWVIEARAK